MVAWKVEKYEVCVTVRGDNETIDAMMKFLEDREKAKMVPSKKAEVLLETEQKPDKDKRYANIITPDEYSKKMGISYLAACSKLSKMASNGNARRLRRGVYRIIKENARPEHMTYQEMYNISIKAIGCDRNFDANDIRNATKESVSRVWAFLSYYTRTGRIKRKEKEHEGDRLSFRFFVDASLGAPTEQVYKVEEKGMEEIKEIKEENAEGV